MIHTNFRELNHSLPYFAEGSSYAFVGLFESDNRGNTKGGLPVNVERDASSTLGKPYNSNTALTGIRVAFGEEENTGLVSFAAVSAVCRVDSDDPGGVGCWCPAIPRASTRP